MGGGRRKGAAGARCGRPLWGGFALALAALALAPAARAAEAEAPLFRVERSKNANVVQYDARLAPDGRLDPEEPVVAYWLRLARDGRREPLKWLERRLAYGFAARLAAQRGEAVLEMAAPIGRPLRVREVGGAWRAETRIGDRPALVDRIYVRSDESAAWPRVVYVDLHGTDAQTGVPLFERLVPGD